MNDSVMKEQKTIIVRENNSKSIKINVLQNDSYYDLIEKIEKKRGMQWTCSLKTDKLKKDTIKS